MSAHWKGWKISSCSVYEAGCLRHPNLLLKACRVAGELLVFGPYWKAQEGGLWHHCKRAASVAAQQWSHSKATLLFPVTFLGLDCGQNGLLFWGRVFPLQLMLFNMPYSPSKRYVFSLTPDIIKLTNVLLFFHTCDKHCPKPIWIGKGLFGFQVSVLCGWNSKQELKQIPQRNAAYCHTFSGMLSYFSYSSPVLPAYGWCHPHQSSVPKMPSQTWPRVILIEAIPQLGFPLPKYI